jgi:hypothetical protein
MAGGEWPSWVRNVLWCTVHAAFLDGPYRLPWSGAAQLRAASCCCWCFSTECTKNTARKESVKHYNSLVFLPIFGTLLVQGFIFERGPTISKVFKELILYRFVQIKVHWKTFHPFSPLHFLPEFFPHTEFKGRPEDTKWNVLYHTALRNYAAISLQVPSILSILLALIHSVEQADINR